MGLVRALMMGVVCARLKRKGRKGPTFWTQKVLMMVFSVCVYRPLCVCVCVCVCMCVCVCVCKVQGSLP